MPILFVRPQYILQPTAWTKVLPPHFLEARETALQRAQEYEIAMHGSGMMNGPPSPAIAVQQHNMHIPQHSMDGGVHHMEQPMMGHHLHTQDMQMQPPMLQQMQGMPQHLNNDIYQQHQMGMMQYQHLPVQQNPMTDGMPVQQPHYAQQDDQMLPMDEAAESPPRPMGRPAGMDPPDDEPPSLRKRGESVEETPYYAGQQPQFSQGMQHQNGYGYGEQQEQIAPYPKENSVASSRPGEEYNHDSHAYPVADRHRYPTDQPNIQAEQRYPSVERERMQYQESPGMHQVDNGFSNGDQPGMEFQNDGLNGHHSGEDQYDNMNQHGTEYHEDEQHAQQYHEEEAPSPQYYQDKPDEEASYNVPPDKTEDSDDFHQPSLQYSEDKHGGYYAESKEETTEGPDDPSSPQEDSLSPLKFDYSADPTEDPGNDQISPVSQGNQQSEYSHTSSAMRGARELLKRNRQRRLELAARRSQDTSENGPKSGQSAKEVISPQSEVSGGTWESGSEVTSVVSGTSSGWTENSGAPERSSRRALILQMAKARMKNNKSSGASVAGESASEFGNPEIMGTYSITEEEKKLDGPLEEDQNTDIDIAGDLD